MTQLTDLEKNHLGKIAKSVLKAAINKKTNIRSYISFHDADKIPGNVHAVHFSDIESSVISLQNVYSDARLVNPYDLRVDEVLLAEDGFLVKMSGRGGFYFSIKLSHLLIADILRHIELPSLNSEFPKDYGFGDISGGLMEKLGNPPVRPFRLVGRPGDQGEIEVKVVHYTRDEIDAFNALQAERQSHARFDLEAIEPIIKYVYDAQPVLTLGETPKKPSKEFPEITYYRNLLKQMPDTDYSRDLIARMISVHLRALNEISYVPRTASEQELINSLNNFAFDL